jgi:hypothetical protein
MRTPPSGATPVSKHGTSRKLVLYPKSHPHPLEHGKGYWMVIPYVGRKLNKIKKFYFGKKDMQ